MAKKKKATPSKSKAKKVTKKTTTPKKTAKKVVAKKIKPVAPKKVAKKVSKPEKKVVKKVKVIAPKVKVEKPKVAKEKAEKKKEVAPKVAEEKKAVVKEVKKKAVAKEVAPKKVKSETPTPKDENKLDFERVFDVKAGTKLLYDSLNIGGDVKIRRTESFRYEITGLMTDGVTPFVYPFDCNPKSNDGDVLWQDLLNYEKAVKSGSDVKKVAEPAVASETKKPVDNTVKKENSTPSPVVAETINTVSDNDAIIAKMQGYGNSVAETIRNTFQVKVQGGIAQGDVQRLLNASSKEYTYEIKADQNGRYIILSQGANSVRVPQDESTYLPIN